MDAAMMPANAVHPHGAKALRIYFAGYAAATVGYGAGELGIYTANGAGNIAQNATIKGSKTGLVSPQTAVLDAQGRVWTCDFNNPYITAFGAGASGNVAPTISIGGSYSPLFDCTGLVLSGNGTIYVSSFVNKYQYGPAIYRWAAGSHGNVPGNGVYTGTKTELNGPSGLALTSSGKVVVGGNTSVSVFGTTTGDVKPLQLLAGSTTTLTQPYAVAVDPSTQHLIVADSATSHIAVFAGNATGNAAPLYVIGGTKTRLVDPYGVAMDGAGYLYVGNCPQNGGSKANHGSIAVFAPGAKGNVAPVQLIVGNKTDLSCVDGLTVK
jgi:hypothetical protein